MFTQVPIYVLVAALCQSFTSAFASTLSSPKAQLEPRQSSASASVQALATFSQQWSTVPAAFSTCQSSFSQRVSVEVAVKAVITLRQQLQPVIDQYSSCSACSGAVSTQTQYVSQFQSSITRSYQTWQEILQTGQQIYASEWKTQFASQFQSFSSFVEATKSACSSVNLNLGGLLKGIGLNLNLFLGININLGGLVGGLLGGLLGGGLKKRQLLD